MRPRWRGCSGDSKGRRNVPGELSARRLFFALWPDPRVRQTLDRLSAGFGAGQGRAQHPLDLHLTLIFLGRVEPARLACIESAAASVPFVPFRLRIDRVGYWKPPRILWCGPGETPDPLARLVADLSERLAECGFQPEARAYAPHVTLLRKARAVPVHLIENPIDWTVSGFALAASDPSGVPPYYRILKKWGRDS